MQACDVQEACHHVFRHPITYLGYSQNIAFFSTVQLTSDPPIQKILIITID